MRPSLDDLVFMVLANVAAVCADGYEPPDRERLVPASAWARGCQCSILMRHNGDNSVAGKVSLLTCGRILWICVNGNLIVIQCKLLEISRGARFEDEMGFFEFRAGRRRPT